MNKFPVLMYHRVVSERCPVPGNDPDESRYGVLLEQFERQLDRMDELGMTGVSVRRAHDRLETGEPVPPDWVVITFDDGNASDLIHAAPMLAAHGYDATFYICGCRVGEDGGLDADMIRELGNQGMHVGAHGMTHRLLTTLDAREEEEEIARSRDLLSDIVGSAVDHFAPPGGRYSERTLQTLKRLSYLSVGTSDFGFNRCDGIRFVYKRMVVTASTSASTFNAMLTGAVAPLLPLYARARTTAWLRSVMGESAYGRLRSVAGGR